MVKYFRILTNASNWLNEAGCLGSFLIKQMGKTLCTKNEI